MISHSRAIRWYRKYNKLYFVNKLNNNPTIIFEHIEGKDEKAAQAYKEKSGNVEIVLNPFHAHDWNYVRQSILHEMAHISIWPKGKTHNYLFDAEIDRLYQLGAYKGLL